MFNVIKLSSTNTTTKENATQCPLYDLGLELRNKGTVIRPPRQMTLTKAVKRVNDVYFMR